MNRKKPSFCIQVFCEREPLFLKIKIKERNMKTKEEYYETVFRNRELIRIGEMEGFEKERAPLEFRLKVRGRDKERFGE
mgnify:FL=1